MSGELGMAMRTGVVAIWLMAVVFLLAGCEARVPPAAVTSTTPSGPSTVSAASTSTQPEKLGIGAEPEVNLRTIDKPGFDALIAAHAGDVLLVDVWATWCPKCREYFPHSVELSRKFGPEGLAVISLSCDDEQKTDHVLDFLREQEATFQNFRAVEGSDEKTFEDFAIDGGALPHYKLYDRRGQLSRTFATDPESDKQFSVGDIEAAVADLLRVNP